MHRAEPAFRRFRHRRVLPTIQLRGIPRNCSGPSSRPVRILLPLCAPCMPTFRPRSQRSSLSASRPWTTSRSFSFCASRRTPSQHRRSPAPLGLMTRPFGAYCTIWHATRSCAVTSIVCAALLLRGYRQSGARLLLWSSLCFFCFTIANVLFVLDLQSPEHNLSLVRQLPSLIGVALLLYGLIWASDR